MRYLVCIAILSCCLSGLRTIVLPLAYSDSADDYLLTDSHERAALDMFMSDYRQKVTPGAGLISDVKDTFTYLPCLRSCILCASGTRLERV